MEDQTDGEASQRCIAGICTKVIVESISPLELPSPMLYPRIHASALTPTRACASASNKYTSSAFARLNPRLVRSRGKPGFAVRGSRFADPDLHCIPYPFVKRQLFCLPVCRLSLQISPVRGPRSDALLSLPAKVETPLHTPPYTVLHLPFSFSLHHRGRVVLGTRGLSAPGPAHAR